MQEFFVKESYFWQIIMYNKDGLVLRYIERLRLAYKTRRENL